MELPSNEDEVVESLIQFHQHQANTNIHPEQHYNHYGDHGVVDLFVEQNGDMRIDKCQYLYEIKSEPAVRESTGANEILRQFNRMKEYFFDGTDYEPQQQVFYRLLFIPSDYTLRHLIENYSIYEEALNPYVEERHGRKFYSQLYICHSNTIHADPRGGITVRHTRVNDGYKKDYTIPEIIRKFDPQLAAEFDSTLSEYE